MQEQDSNPRRSASSLKNALWVLFASLVIIIISFIIQIGVDPHYEGMSTDSGVFAYCGEQILSGKLLYRDCWDNKPPGVYYLNAAAILIGGKSPWSVWIFQAVWLTITVLIFYWLQLRIWRNHLAFLPALIFLLTVLYPDFYQGGNFTETYALLPLTLTVGALYAYLTNNKRLYLVGIGVLTASAFLLKPTYIALGIASDLVILYLDLRRGKRRNFLTNMGILLASTVLPLLLVALYWIIQKDFYEFIFAIFLHNQDYVEGSLSLRSLGSTLRMYLVHQPLASLTMLAVIALGVYLSENGRKLLPACAGTAESTHLQPDQMSSEDAQTWLMAGIYISIVLDFCLVAISARNFGHYYEIPLVALTTSSAYLLATLAQNFRQKASFGATLAAAIAAVLVLAAAWGIEIGTRELPSATELKRFFTTNVTVHQPNELERYILENSQPSQSVLIWSTHPSLNFTTGRRSPTRYIFLLHLFTPTPKASTGFGEFLAELKADPPVVIAADLSTGVLPFFGTEGEELCPNCTAEARQGMVEFKQYVQENYQSDGSIYDWLVYKRK